MDRLSPWPVHPSYRDMESPHGETAMDIPGLPQQISAKIRLDESTGCWMWQGPPDAAGYGRAWWTFGASEGRRNYKAHRLVWTMLVGALEPALVLDHLCRTRICVNPEHLEQVTIAENSRRSGLYKRKDECARGHPFSGSNLRMCVNGERKCRACAREDRQRLRRNPAFKAQEAAAARLYRLRQKRRPGPGQAPLF